MVIANVLKWYRKGMECIGCALVIRMATVIYREEESATETEDEFQDERKVNEKAEDTREKKSVKRYLTKRMKLYPELYRSDVSIHPSYTTLKNLPYYVVCRRRVQKIKRQIKRQLNHEIIHFAMMQMFAIDSVRIDRVFSVGMPPKTLIVPDLLTVNERRHMNELLRHT